MRIVPVGIATPLEPLSAFIDAVEETCRLTHNTSEAIGSAAAVAAVVSAGIDGAGFEEALPLALAAARAGERRGTPRRPRAPSRSDRARRCAPCGRRTRRGAASRWRMSRHQRRGHPIRAHGLRRGAAGSGRSVALPLSSAPMIGDDTDTIGAIACGMAGACAGLARDSRRRNRKRRRNGQWPRSRTRGGRACSASAAAPRQRHRATGAGDMSGGLLQLSGVVVDLVHARRSSAGAGEEVETPDVPDHGGRRLQRHGGGQALGRDRHLWRNARNRHRSPRSLRGQLLSRRHSDSPAAGAPPWTRALAWCIVDRRRAELHIPPWRRTPDGAAEHLEALDAGSYDWALLTGYSLFKPESAAAFVPWLGTLGAPPHCLFDPGPIVADIPERCARYRHGARRLDERQSREAEVLTGKPIRRRPRRRLRKGARARWCGSAPMAAGSPAGAPRIPCSRLRGRQAVDTNGAGDTHDGAFLAACMHGHAPARSGHASPMPRRRFRRHERSGHGAGSRGNPGTFSNRNGICSRRRGRASGKGTTGRGTAPISRRNVK